MLLIGFSVIASLSMINAYEYLYSTFVHPRNICYNHNDGVMRLPVEMDRVHIRHLAIKVYSSSHFEIESYTIFQKFLQLEYLEIQAESWQFNLEGGEMRQQLAQELFNLTKLEVLVVDRGGFNSKEHSWRLPSTLMKLVLKNHQYTEFDLSCCPNLKYVDVSYNALTKLPTFTPSLPIDTLIFVGNSLIEFSVNDIAKFCLAKQITIGDYSTGTRQRRCECQRLLKWIGIVGNSTNFDLKCDSEAANKENCSEYTLEEAIKIRDLCIEESNPTTTTTSTTVTENNGTTRPTSGVPKLQPQDQTIYVFAALTAIIVYYNFFVDK